MARIYRDAHGVPHVRADDVLDLAHGQGAVTARRPLLAAGVAAAPGHRDDGRGARAAGLDWDGFARRTRIVDDRPTGPRGAGRGDARLRGGLRRGRQRDAGRADAGPRAGRARQRARSRGRTWTPLAVLPRPAPALRQRSAASSGRSARPTRCSARTPACSTAEGPADGSNAWAVGGARTASGMPLIGGDPHRIIESPGVYQQVRLACEDPDDAFDVVGFAFPGVPGTSSTSPTPARSPGRSPTRWRTTRTSTRSRLDDRTRRRAAASRPSRSRRGRGAASRSLATAVGDCSTVERDRRPRAQPCATRSTVLGDSASTRCCPLLRARTADDVDRPRGLGGAGEQRRHRRHAAVRSGTGWPAGCRCAPRRTGTGS